MPRRKIKHKMIIDGEDKTLYYVWTEIPTHQYNEIDNTVAHTFKDLLINYPINREFKTNGHTYIRIT